MKHKRTHHLDIRVTQQELLLIKSLAMRANMNVSKFILHAAFNLPITVYEVDSKAILKPLLGLQRHYNNIRYKLQQEGEHATIVSPEKEKEIDQLWQLLAQAKQVKAP